MLSSKPFLTLALTFCVLLLGGAAHAAEELNDFEDLAGLLTKDAGGRDVLYAMNGHDQEVLHALDAKPTTDGRYEALVEKQIVRFDLVPVAYPAFFLQLVCATPSVRVYRNATCVQTQAASLSPCFPFNPPSHYAKFRQDVVRKCRRGFSYCVERNLAYQFRYNYSNSSCSGAFSITTLSSGFIC